jgi:hypothetical protein
MISGDSVKDVGSTSFGLLIAFLLPGFAGMFALAFFAPPVAELFSKFIEAESNVGRFLLMILCSLVVGLEVSIVRWLLFQELVCRKYKREPSSFDSLTDPAKLSAFRAAVDEHYRYHQFWGGMAIVTPFIGWGLLINQTVIVRLLILLLTFIAVEAMNVAAACDAYKNYIDRTNRILRGSANGQRMGTNTGGPRLETPIAPAAAPAAAAAAPAPAPAPAPSEAMSEDRDCGITSAESPP